MPKMSRMSDSLLLTKFCEWSTMMTSSMGTFSALLAFCEGESTGHPWIHLTKASDAEFDVFFHLHLNNRDAGDLRRHCSHYDFTVIFPYDVKKQTKFLSVWLEFACICRTGRNCTHFLTCFLEIAFVFWFTYDWIFILALQLTLRQQWL